MLASPAVAGEPVSSHQRMEMSQDSRSLLSLSHLEQLFMSDWLRRFGDIIAGISFVVKVFIIVCTKAAVH